MTPSPKAYGKIALIWIFFIALAFTAFNVISPDSPAPPDSPAYDKTIGSDAGGNVREYILAVNLAAIRGEKVRITGRCASACTMYLRTDVGCVTPRAVLQFHAAFDQKAGQISQASTALMASYYPAPLREWFMKNAAHLSGKKYAELTGAQAIKLGVNGC
jgi:hypothetical protein